VELLQQFEVVVAGNAEQVPDAGLVETAKQEVADFHSSAGAVRFCLLRCCDRRHCGVQKKPAKNRRAPEFRG
jgi:hypothetical protein